MAAALLVDTLYTLFPEPEASDLVHAGGGDPSWRTEYDRLIESVRWTAPLWREGVIRTGTDTASVLSGYQEATRTDADIRWPSRLQTLIARQHEAPAETTLGSLCRDIRLGGVTPSVMLPVTLALDRFAATNDIARYEEARETGGHARTRRRAPALAAFPMLLDTGADQILELREQLREELESVRQALTDISASDPDIRAGEDTHAFGRLQQAAETYRTAFMQYLEDEPAIRGESKPAMASLALGVRSADTSVEYAERILSPSGREGHRRRGPGDDADEAPLECTFLRLKRLPWQV